MRTLKASGKPVTKKRIIIGSIVTFLYILFSVWAGWGWFILLPLVVDYYFLGYINWGWYRSIKNKALRAVVSLFLDILFAVIAVSLLSIFFFQNFTIPSSSLEKTLLTGDYLFVDKLHYGPRMPMTPIAIPLTHNTFHGKKSYSDKPLLPYKRLKGFSHIKRNDIVVFNFPAGDTVALLQPNPDYYTLIAMHGRDAVWNNPQIFGKIVYRPVDRRDHYVKRCVGLPGETLEVRDNTVYINGEAQPFPAKSQHNYNILVKKPGLSDADLDKLGISMDDRQFLFLNESNREMLYPLHLVLPDDNLDDYVLYHMPLTHDMFKALDNDKQVVSMMIEPDPQGWYTYPLDGNFGWSRDNYGPILIPKKGLTITLDRKNLALYRRCIVAYEGHSLSTNSNDNILIDGKVAHTYTFAMDYYFMMGDNRHNSADSRSWGFVPEDHVVGRPGLLWLSLNKDKKLFSGKVRWSRMFHIINK